jgi:colanic acid biosynthesis glycosyl transferase WcaI
MRTLLMTLVFAPDGVSTAAILTELTSQLRSRGHHVTVVTTTPHYNHDADTLASQPLTRKWRGLLRESRSHGTPVYHVPVRPKGRRVLSRLVDYFKFHAIGTLVAPIVAGRYDVVFAPSPPLTVGLSAMLLGWFRRVPFVYNVQEIYPDIAVSLGLLRNPLLIRSMLWLEGFVYRRATVVVVISDRFRQRLLDKGVPAAKLKVIPNFVDVEFMQPRSRDNAFAREYGLAGKFVVLYAGNVGLTQDFEAMLAAAHALTDRPNVHFAVVGDGARREWLEGEIVRRGLSNVSLLPYQPRNRVPDVYGSAAVCLVPMQAGTAQETFPSKIYTIMASARPAVVAADPDSELSAIVAQVRCGRAVPPGDGPAMANAIRELEGSPDEARACGERGRLYVVERHSPSAVAALYDDLLRGIAASA